MHEPIAWRLRSATFSYAARSMSASTRIGNLLVCTAYPINHEDDFALALATGRRRVDVQAEAVLLARHERAFAQDEVERAPARWHQHAVVQINHLGATSA